MVRRRVDGQVVTPSSGLWTVEDWEFNVTATSGDTIPMRMELQLKQAGGGFQTCNVTYFPSNPCVNVTSINATNAQGQSYSYRGFSQKQHNRNNAQPYQQMGRDS